MTDLAGLLRVTEVARRRGVTRAQVYAAIERGDLAVETFDEALPYGEKYRIREADADAWDPRPHPKGRPAIAGAAHKTGRMISMRLSEDEIRFCKTRSPMTSTGLRAVLHEAMRDAGRAQR